MLSGVLWLTASKIEATEIVAIVVMFVVLLAFNVADEARFFGLIDIGRRVMYAGLGVAMALLAMAMMFGTTGDLPWSEWAVAQVEGHR